MDKVLTKIIGGNVFTPEGVKKGATVIVEGNRIAEVTDASIEITDSNVIDATGMNVVPGGIELHIHGGGGSDFMECTPSAYRNAMNAHMLHGTTSFYPTISSGSVQMMIDAVEASKVVMNEPNSAMLGLHIEGPYFNPEKAGAQMKQFITPPIKEDYERIISGSDGVIKRWDEAPELPGTVEFGEYLCKHGILPSIAHTKAEYPDVKKAYDAGFTHATHFYNAMTGFHNVREFKHEGTVESIYAIPDMTVEVVADGVHVPPTILKMIYLVKGVEKTSLITDALACSVSDSTVAFDPRVIIEDGVCKLSDHSALAGSIATMDRLIRTMVSKAEIPLFDVIRMTSETPARIMGVLDRKGTLEKGKDADIVMYDSDINVKWVMQMGQIVPLKK